MGCRTRYSLLCVRAVSAMPLVPPFYFPDFSFSFSFSSSLKSMLLSITISVSVAVITQESPFICAVSSESDGCYTQAGESAPKSIEPGERSSVTPSFTANAIVWLRSSFIGNGYENTHYRAQGSLLAYSEEGDEAATNFFMSKPVGFGGAMVMCGQSVVLGTEELLNSC